MRPPQSGDEPRVEGIVTKYCAVIYIIGTSAGMMVDVVCIIEDAGMNEG